MSGSWQRMPGAGALGVGRPGTGSPRLQSDARHQHRRDEATDGSARCLRQRDLVLGAAPRPPRALLHGQDPLQTLDTRLKIKELFRFLVHLAVRWLMALAINIRADNASASEVERLWDQVAAFEDAPSMRALGYRPHFTFAIYDSPDIREKSAWEAMLRAAEGEAQLRIEFRRIRWFLGPPPWRQYRY
jgi:hypothetical protein